MSLTVITPDCHKIAECEVKVKYRRPGNVVEYLPVKFEVFREGECYKAVPLQDTSIRILTNLPRQIFFHLKNGKVVQCSRGQQEIMEELVTQMVSREMIVQDLSV
jgi:hypothetical protein